MKDFSDNGLSTAFDVSTYPYSCIWLYFIWIIKCSILPPYIDISFHNLKISALGPFSPYSVKIAKRILIILCEYFHAFFPHRFIIVWVIFQNQSVENTHLFFCSSPLPFVYRIFLEINTSLVWRLREKSERWYHK